MSNELGTPPVPPAPQPAVPPVQYPPAGAQPQPFVPQSQPQQGWSQTGPIASPYAPQPGAYPPGYAPVPMAPVPPREPSPMLKPAYWAAKLPILAVVVLAGYVLFGLVDFVYTLASNAYGPGNSAYYAIFSGSMGLLPSIVYGVVAFGVLMGLARVCELVADKDDKK